VKRKLSIKSHEMKLILEVKGLESEQDRQKEVAAKRWVKAINNHGEFGRWDFMICKDPSKLKMNIETLIQHYD